MKSYLEKHHRIFGLLCALIAFVIAVIYLEVVPEEASNADLIQKIILAYGHSLCWFLLSGASMVWSIKRKNQWSVYLAYAALAVYVIFIGTLLITKFA
ncbi:hypothetical protein A2707_03880 [Candidatus Saccharibacteria bacterium RIFCSPHIGHO2_01_FULL_45_15]|nr:MAG: hypothetical protein A2707_03880 [Candidatus Saccharibacteria bacterium RIFCSPHIGHO2_01_FULL_45_15]OGL31588.1 MAG: hypothetical protein A3E76_02540 [Candidatus Saccharibacteria bacterium RIFCSPHIGHO2_12_FULL_44_22]